MVSIGRKRREETVGPAETMSSFTACSEREQWHNQCRNWWIRFEFPLPLRKRSRGSGRRCGQRSELVDTSLPTPACHLSVLQSFIWFSSYIVNVCGISLFWLNLRKLLYSFPRDSLYSSSIIYSHFNLIFRLDGLFSYILVYVIWIYL